MNKVITWVDGLKSICIFLVVYGHFYAIDHTTKTLIYSVHLPAFLFVTGYLSSQSLTKDSLQNLVKGPLRYYVSLYAVFSMAACVIWYALEARHQPLTEILKPLYGSALGLHGPKLNMIHNNDPLWYFPFLVTSLLFTHIALRLPVAIQLCALLPLAALYVTASLPPLPWSLDLAPLGAFFILLGVHIRRLEGENKQPLQALNKPVVVTMLFLVWLTLTLLNDQINMNSRSWGASWFLFMGAAVTGTAFLVGICQRLPASNLIRSLSSHTLVIFCCHIYLTKVANKPIARLPESARGWAVLLAAVMITLTCWGISIKLQPVLTRWLKPKPARDLRMQKTG